MFSKDFITDHYRRCDESDANPTEQGKIEAALDSLVAAGVRKIAFDIEGVLLAQAPDFVPQLRRPAANAVLRLTADRMPVKPILWSAAGVVHVKNIIEQAALVVPQGVDVIDANRFMRDVVSPGAMISTCDEIDINTFLRERGTPREQTVRLDQRVSVLVQELGIPRVRAYCGVSEDTPFADLCKVGATTALNDADLRNDKQYTNTAELKFFLYEYMRGFHCKPAHFYNVDLLLDDRSATHRMTAVLLGYKNDANAVRYVPKFELSDATESSVIYHCGSLRTQNADDYFALDHALVESLAAGRFTPPQSR